MAFQFLKSLITSPVKPVYLSFHKSQTTSFNLFMNCSFPGPAFTSLLFPCCPPCLNSPSFSGLLLSYMWLLCEDFTVTLPCPSNKETRPSLLWDFIIHSFIITYMLYDLVVKCSNYKTERVFNLLSVHKLIFWVSSMAKQRCQ